MFSSRGWPLDLTIRRHFIIFLYSTFILCRFLVAAADSPNVGMYQSEILSRLVHCSNWKTNIFERGHKNKSVGLVTAFWQKMLKESVGKKRCAVVQSQKSIENHIKIFVRKQMKEMSRGRENDEYDPKNYFSSICWYDPLLRGSSSHFRF